MALTNYKFCILLLLGANAWASEAPSAANHISFEEKTDGKCHNLSEGGKLLVMYNNHPSEAISFRLIRYYIDVRQRGGATGIAQPGGEPIKIGCTQVGGRPQRWEIQRAHFVTDEKS